MFKIKQLSIFKQYNFKKYNIFLLLVVLTVSLAGAYFVKLAGGDDYGESYFRGQIQGIILGGTIAVVVSLIDYHFLCRFVVLYYFVGILMLAATKFSPFGSEMNTNCYRWLEFGGFSIQPSELCKIILILTLSVYYTKREDDMDKFRVLFASAFLTAVPTVLIMLQPNLSSVIVILAIFAFMVFAAGISYKIIGIILAVGLPTGIFLFWYIQQPFQKLITGYQQKRILDYLNPEENALGGLYQQNASYNAIASGGLLGKMFDTSSSTRLYRHCDVIESDFIFAVIGEEVGFIGCCVMIGLLGLIIALCFLTAKKARDRQGMLIAIGVGSLFMIQTFANVGVAVRMLPNTGLPLPFISRGLSSMVSYMIGIGVVLNVSLQSSRNKSGGFSMI